MCLSLCVSLHVSHYVSHCVSHYVSHCVCLTMSLTMYLTMYLTACLSLRVFRLFSRVSLSPWLIVSSALLIFVECRDCPPLMMGNDCLTLTHRYEALHAPQLKKLAVTVTTKLRWPVSHTLVCVCSYPQCSSLSASEFWFIS